MKPRHTFTQALLSRTARYCLYAGALCLLALGTALRSQASIIYTLTSTSANTVSDWTWLLPDTNASQIYMVFANGSPGGGNATSDPHPFGVWFSSYYQNWAVFNEDVSAMPVGAGFTVWTRPAQDNVYTHVATAANTNGPFTYLDNIYTNGNPYALIWVTPNWNPGGRSYGVYNPHNITVAYDSQRGRWAIANQDSASMPSGAAFNVIIESGEYYPHYYIMRNPTSYYIPAIYLNVPSINGAPNAHIAVTPNYNPSGASLYYGVLNNHPLTVKYDTSRQMWYLVNQDGALFAPSAAFNVWLLNAG